jgi:hypothetical protein
MMDKRKQMERYFQHINLKNYRNWKPTNINAYFEFLLISSHNQLASDKEAP